MDDPIMWIIIGVVALIVIIALIALVTRSSNKKKLTAAADLRKDAREREQQLERQHSVAREQEHRAAAAEQEAKAKAAEAERMRAEADEHHSAIDEQRRDVRRMEQHADKLDPRHRADDLGGDTRHGTAKAGDDRGTGPVRDVSGAAGAAGAPGNGGRHFAAENPATPHPDDAGRSLDPRADDTSGGTVADTEWTGRDEPRR